MHAQNSKLQIIDGAVEKANEMIMLKAIQGKLEQHYPGHFWMVGINQSVIIIRNTLLSGEHGYVIHIPAIYSGSWLDDEVVRAGGTILEVYRQRRAKMNLDHIVGLPTDYSGRHLIPAGAIEPGVQRTRILVR